MSVIGFVIEKRAFWQTEILEVRLIDRIARREAGSLFLLLCSTPRVHHKFPTQEFVSMIMIRHHAYYLTISQTFNPNSFAY